MSRTVAPAQMNFPHAAQIARLERTRNLKAPQSETEVVWLITSLSAEQADAARLLALARAYWGIENGGHGRLDGSAFEDACRVRHPVAATALG
ncbi:MAG TPA: ISAs1 family transposase, partial [Verrucomicrobiae bacterium]